MNENETPAKNTISIKKYAGVIESDPDKEIKDIESRLNQIRDFQEDPEHRQWIAEHGENICPFCDRVIPLTRFAIGKYKKRAKIPKFENSQLAQHLAEKKAILIQKTFAESGIEKRDWNLASAARGICNMLYFCEILIGMAKSEDLAENQKIGTMSPFIAIWDSKFVEFSAAFFLATYGDRKLGGDKAFDKNRKKLKDWCISRAYEKRALRPSCNKSQIAQEIMEEMHADKNKWRSEGCIILTGDNGLHTLKNRWLPKGKPSEWPDKK